MPALRLGPSGRITLGLVMLVLVLYSFLDVVVGVVPDEEASLKEVRDQVSSNLALELGALLRTGDQITLTHVMRELQRQNDELISLGIRGANGRLIAQTALHDKLWLPPPDNHSTLNRVQVPLYDANNEPWVTIEINYRPYDHEGLAGLLRQPSIAMPLGLLVGGFVAFYLYLRKVLQHLDPSKVIPGRVSNALDTLTEGVIIFDPRGRIVLVNQSIRSLHPEAASIRLGQKSETLDWLVGDYRKSGELPPWTRALRDKKKITGERMVIPQGDGKVKKFIVNASPIHDGDKKIRGCLTTFQDVTRQEEIMAKLRESQQRIANQNVALQRLANYDQLTQLLNRRAFYERGEQLFARYRRSGRPLAFIMCDIDHFKSVNDNYGHPVGDEAIRAVTSLLRKNVRKQDLVGRYGGEEFCLLVPDLSPKQVAVFAEHLRATIEREAGPAIESVPGLRITSSFGVSILTPEVETLDQFIEQGDQALYQSKKNGRNTVSFYQPKTQPRNAALASGN